MRAQRGAQAAAAGPVRMPGDVRSRPETGRALRGRDPSAATQFPASAGAESSGRPETAAGTLTLTAFGGELRRFMEERGIGVRALAQRVPCDKGHISRAANGKTWLSPHIASRCDEVLRTDGKLTELLRARPVPQAALRSTEDVEDFMKRRAFLASAGALAGLLQTDQVAALAATRRQLTESIPGRQDFDVTDWGNVALEYGESYPVTAPSELVGPLLTDFSGLGEAFRRYRSESAQRELFRVAALLAGFLAQTANRLGHLHEAKNWWRMARYAADRAQDSYSPLWVRAREINAATIPMSGRPMATVLRLVEDAERFTGAAAPELVLDLLSNKAQTLAIAGNRREAGNVLTQVYQRFETTSFSGYGGSLLGWGEERLRNAEIFIFSRLGDLKRLETAQQASVSVYKQDASNYSWPTFNALNKAFCLVRTGDVAQGTTYARSVIDGLPGTLREQSLFRRALEISRIMPEPTRDEPAIGEYREWMNSAFPSQPILAAG
jgi:helix-turn-helix protein